MAGKFFETRAQTSLVTCKDCVAGRHQDQTGQSDCKGTACAAGKFFENVAQTAAVTCKDCVLGQFTASTGQTSCTLCDFGQHQTTSLGSHTACEGSACVAGKFFETLAESSPVTCKDLSLIHF